MSEESDELKDQMLAEIDVLMELMNAGEFDEIVGKMESLDKAANLDITLTYLNTIAMCYEKIEEAYCKFYTEAYAAFQDAYGEERAEKILAARRPAKLDQEYKNPTAPQAFLTAASDKLFGLNIERGTTQ
jgi:hypothetical protein